MLKYKKQTTNGFAWTTDVMTGDKGFTRHRLYTADDNSNPVAVIHREKGLYHLRIAGSGRKRTFGELRKAKVTAEHFISLRFWQLGFKLVRRGR